MTRKLVFIEYNLRNGKIWIALVFIFMVIAMLMTNPSCTIGAENRIEKKRFYIYSDRELSVFFKNIGYQDLWDNDMVISRNSDGTVLRFLNGRKGKILIVTCDGSVKVVDSPGYLAWLNDANKVIAWITWTDNTSKVHYANGMSEKLPFSPQGSGPDHSGKYLIKENLNVPASQSCNTSIYATERPEILLATVDVCGASKIFYKDNKVFLTGRQYRDGNLQEEEIRVFRVKGNALEQMDRIVVHSPNKSKPVMLFYAVDLSPWDDEMLFIDFYDFPARSIWYSFNLKTHQLNKVGKVPWFGGRAFYLQCDIIKKVILESQEKPK